MLTDERPAGRALGRRREQAAPPQSAWSQPGVAASVTTSRTAALLHALVDRLVGWSDHHGDRVIITSPRNRKKRALRYDDHEAIETHVAYSP